ncbi:TetR/AcrR family transcriptional regulator [Spongiactinospora sp. TRM90649]|uniref:TetR/AcrR family transcriptional regulator n=1 Tax=Spongiactinospora sp. TRM90649 TaxID=3031114 RepID=UPI0023F74E5C|nr:TetR/AcrR family transcriptional regulator [Spongiactinospora sp. TRM90649]MDF5754497.1 TetR/AcrR family transcriptional regulator [Spongiactinospora sp. TRM90649]
MTELQQTSPSQDEGRSARKHRAIMEAATELFLRNGYQGTSMDEVAALAAVSKQTVYKHFTDKEQLFSAIIIGATARVGDFTAIVTEFAATENLEKDLGELARHYITVVIQPRTLRLRRLLIAEAGRFPEVAREYYQRAPGLTIDTFADTFRKLDGRGLLRIDDPSQAASHFAWLILSQPMEKAMFFGDEQQYTPAELRRFADEGVRVFLAAYRI